MMMHESRAKEGFNIIYSFAIPLFEVDCRQLLTGFKVMNSDRVIIHLGNEIQISRVIVSRISQI